MNAEDAMDLWQDLALAVKRGQPVGAALRELAGESRGEVRVVAERVAGRVEAGAALSEAVAGEGRLFGPGVVAALRAGERGGDVGRALGALARGAGEGESLRRMVLGAVAYPMVVACAATAVAVFLRVGVIPVFYDMYNEFNMTLPEPTLWLGAITATIGTIIGVSALGLFFLYLTNWRPWPAGRFCDAVRLRVPLVGRLARRQALARFCGVMDALVVSGAPEAEAARLAGQATGNLAVMAACEQAAQGVEAGERLSHAMRAAGFFPWAMGIVAEATANPWRADRLRKAAVLCGQGVDLGAALSEARLDPGKEWLAGTQAGAADISSAFAALGDEYAERAAWGERIALEVGSLTIIAVAGLFVVSVAFGLVVPIWKLIGAVGP